MRTIWKYVLDSTTRRNDLPVPKGSKLLAVQAQGTDLMVWFLVNPDSILTYRGFWVYHSETSLPEEVDNFSFIATVQIKFSSDNSYNEYTHSNITAFHVFEDLSVFEKNRSQVN